MRWSQLRNSRWGSTGALFIYRFILIFVLLMTAHYFTRLYTAYLLITKLNAGVSAWIINLLTPAQQAVVEGQLIRSGSFVLTVARGCDGLDGIILLSAALMAYPLPIKRMLAGLAYGISMLYAGNLVRIISLYYIARYKPGIFDFAHIYVWQTLTIFIGWLFFMFWIRSRGGTAARCCAGSDDNVTGVGYTA